MEVKQIEIDEMSNIVGPYTKEEIEQNLLNNGFETSKSNIHEIAQIFLQLNQQNFMKLSLESKRNLKRL